ncbi:Vacuolar membrane-associated protein Iml1 [Trinorchestia longiramus]|nr:Vacuolar membrane-associated protein Iml1 [Trinorchestia longiramus]
MAASTHKDQPGRGFVYKSLSMKLIFHQKSYKAEEVLLNLTECGFAAGDVLEIYHKRMNSEGRAERAYPRLLLQVPHTLGSEENVTLKNFLGTNTISVEQSVALQFKLQQFEHVRVTRINPEKVALQLLEITFKDQYLNRSDMWRLTKHLVRSVVYKNKTVEFCPPAIRCQVYEMWSQGSRVACGYVSSDTKVVYRSSTSRFYLFIQMSSEMWEFDHFGDLYFEKAVSGFLTDLFDKWKRMNTNHDVTIVLFSRSFYPTAKSLDEFPVDMRACVQVDPLGRFYQDFYRSVVLVSGLLQVRGTSNTCVGACIRCVVQGFDLSGEMERLVEALRAQVSILNTKLMEGLHEQDVLLRLDKVLGLLNKIKRL